MVVPISVVRRMWDAAGHEARVLGCLTRSDIPAEWEAEVALDCADLRRRFATYCGDVGDKIAHADRSWGDLIAACDLFEECRRTG